MNHKNHWTKHRFVFIHFDAFYKLNPYVCTSFNNSGFFLKKTKVFTFNSRVESLYGHRVILYMTYKLRLIFNILNIYFRRKKLFTNNVIFHIYHCLTAVGRERKHRNIYENVKRCIYIIH